MGGGLQSQLRPFMSSVKPPSYSYHVTTVGVFPTVNVCAVLAEVKMATIPLVNLLDALLQKAYHDLNVLQEL